MSTESAAIYQGFHTRQLGYNNPPRTALQLARYTASGLKPTVFHVARFSEIPASNAPVTGISVLTYGEFRNLSSIIAGIREKNPSTYIIAGGTYISIFPEQIIDTPGLNAIALGYGENAWKEVTTNIYEGRQIQNISGVYSLGGKIPSKEERQFSQPIPLKKMEQPNYESLKPNISTYFPQEPTTAEEMAISSIRPNILGGIGCSDRCIFCIAGAIQNNANFGRRPVELMPPAKIIEEAQILQKFSQQKELALYLANPDSLTDIDHFQAVIDAFNRIDPGKNIKLSLDAKIKSMSKLADFPEIIEKLSGRLQYIVLGGESLSPRIMDYIGSKHYTLDELRFCIDLCDLINAVPLVQLIAGFPMDTDQTLSESLDELLKIQQNPSTPPFIIQTHCLSPFPGTLAYEDAIKMNLIGPDDEIADFASVQSTMGTKSLTRNEVVRWKQKILDSFYSTAYFQRLINDHRGKLLTSQVEQFYKK